MSPEQPASPAPDATPAPAPETRPGREARESRPPHCEPREPRDAREGREHREPREPREPRESRPGRPQAGGAGTAHSPQARATGGLPGSSGPAVPPTPLPPEAEAELRTPPADTSTSVDAERISADARERSKQLPILQRIIKAVRRDQSPFREIIINSEPLEKRVALLVNGTLEKFEIERAGEDRLVGSVFKGRIQNLEPGLKAAFVDIGMPKNAFLHYWDILPEASDANAEFVRENLSAEEKSRRERITIKDIPKLYPVGTDIVIQVSKGTIGTKGPRTTTNLVLPGRYLLLMPYGGQCGISRKIEEPAERLRLKKIIKALTLPEGMGVIIRTAGEGKKLRWFIRDLHILLKTWEEIKHRIESAREPARVYQEPDIIERTVRDFLTEEVDRILIDNEADYNRMVELVGRISPRSRGKLALFKDNIPVFERFNIERQIEQTFQRKVPLPSGGEIVIEETEALTAVDVNTGGHRQKQGDDHTFIVQVNLEAAHEASRQIRLRNIGGLIILDFIDMKNPRDRKLVLKKMREEMSKDKSKCHILPISSLGIMEMTRQRQQESIGSGIYAPCPYCHGRGIVKSPRSMSVEIQRRLVSVIRRLRARSGYDKKLLQFRLFCHPSTLDRLRAEDEPLLLDLERLYNVKLAFRADHAYHAENFKIFDAETNQELR